MYHLMYTGLCTHYLTLGFTILDLLLPLVTSIKKEYPFSPPPPTACNAIFHKAK